MLFIHVIDSSPLWKTTRILGRQNCSVFVKRELRIVCGPELDSVLSVVMLSELVVDFCYIIILIGDHKGIRRELWLKQLNIENCGFHYKTVATLRQKVCFLVLREIEPALLFCGSILCAWRRDYTKCCRKYMHLSAVCGGFRVNFK